MSKKIVKQTTKYQDLTESSLADQLAAFAKQHGGTVRHGPQTRKPAAAPAAPQPAAPVDRAALAAELKQLQAEFDPQYQYSDDYSFWSKQDAIAKRIAYIKKQLSVEEAKETEYGPEWDEKIAKVKKLASQGPMKTVYDPAKRVYKNVPVDNASTTEGLKDPEDNPCWRGYHPVGTKKKNGKTVPNCVPNASKNVNEEVGLEIDAALAQIAAAGADGYEMIYAGLSGSLGHGVQRTLQDMYDEISRTHGLHPDDDFEKIQDHMMDRLEDEYGQQGVAEGWGSDDVTSYQSGYTLWTRTQSAGKGEPRYWLYRTPKHMVGQDDRRKASVLLNQTTI